MISKIYNFLQSVEEVSVVSLISLLQKWASISCSLEALLQARKKKKKRWRKLRGGVRRTCVYEAVFIVFLYNFDYDLDNCFFLEALICNFW